MKGDFNDVPFSLIIVQNINTHFLVLLSGCPSFPAASSRSFISFSLRRRSFSSRRACSLAFFRSSSAFRSIFESFANCSSFSSFPLMTTINGVVGFPRERGWVGGWHRSSLLTNTQSCHATMIAFHTGMQQWQRDKKEKWKKVGDVTFGATNYRFFFMRHGCDGKYGEDPILHLQVAKGKKTHDFHKTSQNKKNQTKNYNLMG